MWLIWLMAAAFILVFLALSVAHTAGREVRCPQCTQQQVVARDRQDYNCRSCGAPILRAGQFVAAAEK